jgi:hypothetical protein
MARAKVPTMTIPENRRIGFSDSGVIFRYLFHIF